MVRTSLFHVQSQQFVKELCLLNTLTPLGVCNISDLHVSKAAEICRRPHLWLAKDIEEKTYVSWTFSWIEMWFRISRIYILFVLETIIPWMEIVHILILFFCKNQSTHIFSIKIELLLIHTALGSQDWRKDWKYSSPKRCVCSMNKLQRKRNKK